MQVRVRSPMTPGIVLAVASAVSFGVTTPLIAVYGASVSPLMTGALLYAGAAFSSLAARPLAKRSGRPLTFAALPRLAAIALFGAALAPCLLAWGISRAGGTASSLVLNLEAVFTVLLARLLYREHVGSRAFVAALVIFLGSALVALDRARELGSAQLIGLLAVAAATAGWALDNALTRALSEEDPGDVVAAKGALGSMATLVVALMTSAPIPDPRRALVLMFCGATGYGLSLRLYLLAQRRIGAARTASAFASGPFVGAALGWWLGDRHEGPLMVAGTVALVFGVVLHLSERHSHLHVHEALEHEHAHRHDDGHHDHFHEREIVGEHTHAHRHEPTTHEHEHAPDLHHGHTHR